MTLRDSRSPWLNTAQIPEPAWQVNWPFAICHRRLAISASALLLSLLLAASPARGAAAALEPPSTARERALISLLHSNAPPADKALACKQLAIYGSKEAVPALAPLLSDPHLASWARIALEAIPDPAADAALRRAMGKLQGNLLVGVINSIGVRRDAKAVSGLVKRLKARDPDVASAAAVALGRIGGAKAAKALAQAVGTAPEAVRPAAAEGAILCAEGFAAEGKLAEAVKLYDTVRAANVPRQQQLEAIRGAILARQLAGLPLLLEQLRSPDKALFDIGLRTARELPGSSVTEALAAELRRCSPDRQSFLLLALADRSDASVMPAVVAAVDSGSPKLRLTAIGVLERQGDLSSVPVLLKAAVDADPEIAHAGLGALIRLPGNDVDADIAQRIPNCKGKVRQVLFTVAGQRHIDGALLSVLRGIQDPDPGVRSAAVQALGILGSDAQAADLVQLLQETRDPKERQDAEVALLAIISRTGARSVPVLLPVAHNDDSAMRIIALRLLASAGGPDALASVQAAVGDKDEAVQDEAVRTLSTWPNNWPEDGGAAAPLLVLARSEAKTTHQVLALRGYLQCLQTNKRLKNDEKVSKVGEVLPLLKRPEEKRLAIATIGDIPAPGALDLLIAFAEDPAVAEDACSAIVKLVEAPTPAIPQDQRHKALELATKRSASEATKKQARALLKAAQ